MNWSFRRKFIYYTGLIGDTIVIFTLWVALKILDGLIIIENWILNEK